MTIPKVSTLGELKQFTSYLPTVREEMRKNLVAALKNNDPLFPDLHGYNHSVIPQVINSILCGHHLIILGERGQAKSRLIRDVVGLLDESIPAIAGCPIHDNPLAPICTECRTRLEAEGDKLSITWIDRDTRLVEKLATSDVGTADLIGEVDPIRIAQGRTLDDESAIHFGLIPRANRGIFAINELPDLPEKIQVALFNIMEERDLQIKGFPVRLPLDILVVASANPEDYTSRGRIVTPLKDRFDAQIRTHYPKERSIEIAIMEQEARIHEFAANETYVPAFIKEILAEITLQARFSPDISQHSGVSCRATIRGYEAIIGSGQYRCLHLGEDKLVPRLTDLEAIFPAIIGKLEMEYAGQDRSMDQVAQELAQRAVKIVFDEHFQVEELASIVEAFNQGLGAETSREMASDEYMDGLNKIEGMKKAVASLISPENSSQAAASAIEFILEGLHLSNKLNREVIEGRRKYIAGAPSKKRKGRPHDDFDWGNN